MRVVDSRKTKRRLARVGCALFGVVAPIVGAMAQDRFGGSVAVTSDYVYRGVSLSRGRAAYQAGAHWQLPAQWRIGVWGSTIEATDRGTPIETAAFAGRAWALTGNWSMRASYTHYQYFGVRTSPSPDYDELAVALSYRSQLSMNLTWAPNAVRYGSVPQYVYSYRAPDNRASALAIEASWLQHLWKDWSGTAGAGYYDVSRLYRRGYAYWHVGVTGAVGPIELDLLHIDSNAGAERIYGPQVTGARWSALARWRF